MGHIRARAARLRALFAQYGALCILTFVLQIAFRWGRRLMCPVLWRVHLVHLAGLLQRWEWLRAILVTLGRTRVFRVSLPVLPVRCVLAVVVVVVVGVAVDDDITLLPSLLGG